MSIEIGRLPRGFEPLEPFVDRWAITGSANRAAGRDNSTAEERAAFYQAATPLLVPALDLLDQKPIDQFDDAERTLQDMMLSLAHVALAVEVQAGDEARHMIVRKAMRIIRTPADA